MRITTVRTYYGDRATFGGLLEGQFVDIQGLHARRLEIEGRNRPDAVKQAQRQMPNDLVLLLQDDPDLRQVRSLHDWAIDRADSGDLEGQYAWERSKTQLGPAVSSARKIWCMGANYQDHRVEMAKRAGAEAPVKPDKERTPQAFLKSPTSLVGPNDPVVYPPESTQTEHEMELGVVIGKSGRRISHSDAMSHVAGYVAFVDMSARDINKMDNHRMDRSKGFDTFGIMAADFVTADEISDPHNLAIRYWVNDVQKQDGNTKDLVFDIPTIIEWTTIAMTLESGDVISTGTPSGVSKIAPGDRLRGEVENVGSVENVVVEDPRVTA